MKNELHVSKIFNTSIQQQKLLRSDGHSASNILIEIRYNTQKADRQIM